MLSIFVEEVVENHWRRVAGLYDLKTLGSEKVDAKTGESKCTPLFLFPFLSCKILTFLMLFFC
jgi:hypothetical protein